MRAYRYAGPGFASGVLRSWGPATARATVWAHAPTGLLFAASASGEGPYHPAVALEVGERSNLPRGTTLHALSPGYAPAVVTGAFAGGGRPSLEEVEDRGPVFEEEDPEDPGASVPPEDFALLSEPRRDLGVYGLDLAREERESGVPDWFRPNASRRKRRAAWSSLSASERRRYERAQSLAFVLSRRVVGHRYASRHTFSTRASPGTTTVDFEARLYLPEGTAPSAENARDMARVFAELARSLASTIYG